MEVTNINPFSLPSLLLSERQNLPNLQVIYFVIADEKIIYIGQTINLAQRFIRHNKLKQFIDTGSGIRIAWVECTDLKLLKQIEYALIENFVPILNRRRLQEWQTVPPVKTKNLNAVISDNTWNDLEELAEKEMRT